MKRFKVIDRFNLNKAKFAALHNTTCRAQIYLAKSSSLKMVSGIITKQGIKTKTRIYLRADIRTIIY